MNALKLLKDDHDKVKKLLEEGESTTERAVKTREELFAKVQAGAEGSRGDRGGGPLSRPEGVRRDEGDRPRGVRGAPRRRRHRGRA